jgi:hypothetical protein
MANGCDTSAVRWRGPVFRPCARPWARVLGLAWVCGLAALWLAVPSLARADATPQTDLALLNQERTAWGLPGGITDNPTWDSDCAAHDSYEAQNGSVLTHQEVQGNPGYTTGGAFAGLNSILAGAAGLAGMTAWTAGNNPWENAPIHLIQLFTPSLAQTGIDDTGGFQCVVTQAGLTGTPATRETVYTYPGDGTTGFLTSETANEDPFTPGTFANPAIADGTTTGRYIFVYLNEPGQAGQAQVSIQSASLTAPSGPLQVEWVDQTTPTLGPYLTGGMIIPVNPLPEGVQIQASVVLNGPNGPITHNWSFTTAQSPNASVSVTGTSITYTTASPAPAQLNVYAPPNNQAFYILGDALTPGTGPIPDVGNLPTGQPLVACVQQNAAGGYDAQQVCSPPFTIPTPAAGLLGGAINYLGLKATLTGGRLTLTVPALALGQTVRIALVYSDSHCTGAKCRIVSHKSLKRKLTATSLSVLLPSVKHATRVKATVTLASFTKGGRSYQSKPVVIHSGI